MDEFEDLLAEFDEDLEQPEPDLSEEDDEPEPSMKAPLKPRGKQPRKPSMSGWCSFPETLDPDASHARCQRLGHGSTSNPDKEFVPCPCWCHLDTEEYDCGNCGRPLREAPHWLADEPECYVHIDKDGRSMGEEC